MKANELRIGNYVLYFTESDFSEAREISVIHDDNTVRLKDGDSSIGCFSLRKLKPIPLTEEWLLKFNWKRLDKYTYSLGKWFIYKRKRGFVTGSKNREVTLDYVHELQNWWFVNNKFDLEITK